MATILAILATATATPTRSCASCHSPYHATAWALTATAWPTTEPTPTHPPEPTATPAPYTPSGPTPTLAPRPTRTAFTVTARSTATHPTRTATATGTPTAGARRFVVALPLLFRKRTGIRTVAADAAGR